ncbi:MAG: heparinase II/III family protein, partial [Alphaproteobacteria bacterium]|nr:heparinase II/III family protein [Alphaproteobacteria bacterium]
ASLIQGGHAVLVRLAGGIGWRFHHQGGALRLEDSIIMGENGPPRKTVQIVLAGEITEPGATIKWALQREGV